MLKKAICISLCVIMLLSATSVLADDKPINVVIDGVAMEFTDYYGFPVEHNDRIMVPFRQLFEKYGWKAYYEGDTESIFGTKDNDFIAMQIGSTNYISSKKGSVEFEAPIIVNDRTMVPIRVISEILGFKVDYDDATRTVNIDTTAAAQ